MRGLPWASLCTPLCSWCLIARAALRSFERFCTLACRYIHRRPLAGHCRGHQSTCQPVVSADPVRRLLSRTRGLPPRQLVWSWEREAQYTGLIHWLACSRALRFSSSRSAKPLALATLTGLLILAGGLVLTIVDAQSLGEYVYTGC